MILIKVGTLLKIRTLSLSFRSFSKIVNYRKCIKIKHDGLLSTQYPFSYEINYLLRVMGGGGAEHSAIGISRWLSTVKRAI